MRANCGGPPRRASQRIRRSNTAHRSCKTRDRRHLAQMHTPTEGGASPGALSFSLSRLRLSCWPLSPPERPESREADATRDAASPRSIFLLVLASLSLSLSLSFFLARLWPRGFLWTLEPVAPSRCHDSTARRLRSPSAWRIFYFYREVSQFPGPAIRFLWSCRERSGPLAVDFRSRAALGLPVGDGDQKIRDEKSIWWFLLANNWRALKRARGEEKRIDKAGASVWGEIACYYEKAAGGGRRPNETLFSPGISYTP